VIPYVAVLATEQDGIAALPVSCTAALRLVGTTPAGRHEAGAFACATAAAEGDSHGIRVDDVAVIVGDARLDGRDDVRAALGVGFAEVDDLGLILRAYRRWGRGAVDHLRGDFSIAIWDRRERAVVAARDGLGVRPLYYAEVSGGLIISNVINAIRAYPCVGGSLNDAAVASFLHLGWNANLTTTTFAAIRRLAPGTELRRVQGTRAIAIRRHWSLPDPEPVEYARDHEYIERYRDLLGRAVSDRVDPRGTLLFLSGGMDSTTIAVSARRVVPDARITGLTWRAVGVEDATESRLASQVAARCGMPHRLIDAAPAEALAAHPPTPEPVSEPELAQTTSLIGSHARETGARVAIEGEDGDALFAPPSFAAMMRREPAHRVLSRALRYAIREGRKPYVGTWIARRLGLMAADLPDAPPAWLREDTRSLAALAAVDDGTPTVARPEAARSLTRSIWQGVHDGYSRATTHLPLDYRWPLLDTRLIEFVFSVPAIPWCQAKHLARRAFGDDLPAAVVRRRKTTMPGYHRALVDAWRERRGTNGFGLGEVTSAYVDPARLASTLHRFDDPDLVMGAWRALQFDAWARGAIG
jgi:asparagine synthase (glutamine-hydrolysing)